MAKHSLRIDYDDESGRVVINHRCVVNVAGIDVSHSETVEAADDLAPALKAFIDQNREAVERTATGLAISHVAAVNDVPQPGVKRLKVSGSLVVAGEGTVK